MSSPLTGKRSVPRFSIMAVPQAGQASSGRTWPRRSAGTFLLRVFFFMTTTFVLVERDHDAVVPDARQGFRKPTSHTGS